MVLLGAPTGHLPCLWSLAAYLRQVCSLHGTAAARGQLHAAGRQQVSAVPVHLQHVGSEPVLHEDADGSAQHATSPPHEQPSSSHRPPSAISRPPHASSLGGPQSLYCLSRGHPCDCHHPTASSSTLLLSKGSHRPLLSSAPLSAFVHTRPHSSAASTSASVDHLLDLRHPALWYPLARQMRRRIVAHLGPTNSGKTHTALESLKAARTGMYCGPLRLLAVEVSERLRSGGLPCRLVTGQEVGGEEGASHVCCTIEMASLTEQVEVAVLDEIQMIADPGRGWGWTRALLGLPAHTLHVCGAPEVQPLLRTLAEECGDELEVVSYHRLSPLVVMGQALGSVSSLQAGDCLVAFSRRAVHGLKREVLRRTRHPCSVVYGALPPSTRRRQAALFNGQAAGEGADGGASPLAGSCATEASGSCSSSDGSSSDGNISGGGGGSSSSSSSGGGGECASESRAEASPPLPRGRPRGRGPGLGLSAAHVPDPATSGPTSFSAGLASDEHPARPNPLPGPGPRGVLVASDAIGMGLNLNIRRVIFTAMHKYDGTQVRRLSAQEVKQIAGRAGRFRSSHPTGHVTCLHQDDVHLLHEALATRASPLEAACLMPRPEDIAAYATQRRDLRFDVTLESFALHARLSPHYRLGQLENIVKLATMLQNLSRLLTPEELWLFCVSPADSKDPAVAAALLRFASGYARDGVVPADLAVPPYQITLPETEADLKSLEALHRVCDLYVWLAYRLPEQFKDRLVVEEQRTECGAYIALGLDRLTTFIQRKSRLHRQGRSEEGSQEEQEAEARDGASGPDQEEGVREEQNSEEEEGERESELTEGRRHLSTRQHLHVTQEAAPTGPRHPHRRRLWVVEGGAVEAEPPLSVEVSRRATGA